MGGVLLIWCFFTNYDEKCGQMFHFKKVLLKCLKIQLGEETSKGLMTTIFH